MIYKIKQKHTIYTTLQNKTRRILKQCDKQNSHPNASKPGIRPEALGVKLVLTLSKTEVKNRQELYLRSPTHAFMAWAETSPFLCAFGQVAENAHWIRHFRSSVCPYVRVYQSVSHRTDFREI
jgi:hypothetical protein